MRIARHIPSFVARHTVAAAVLFAASCVLWTVVYLLLLVWAVIADAGLGSPVVYPIGLILLFAATASACLMLFMPATLGAEVLCRWQRMPTLVGIPIALALYAVLCFGWSVGAYLIWRFDGSLSWALLLAAITTLALPLGLYWWSAEFPRIAWESVRAVRRIFAQRQQTTHPVAVPMDGPSNTT